MARHLHRKDNAWATEHCVRQIYAMLGIKGVTPTFKTTRTAKGRYRKYPYLLRDRKIRYANEVWATDITYIKHLGRMVYFTAIIDLRSRKILSWRLSESMDVSFCLDALFSFIGSPNISNTVLRSNVTAKIEYIQKKIVIIETRRFMDGPLDNNIGHLRETKNQERNELKETDHLIFFT